MFSVGRRISREGVKVSARHKLNAANLLGCLLLSAGVGGMTGSAKVFVFAAVVLVLLAFHAGGIRPTSRR